MTIHPSRPRLRGQALALALAIAAPFAAGVPAADAAPSASDMESARTAFNEGLALRDKGDLDGAVKKLSAAWALARTPIIGLELGRTLVARTELVEGVDVLASVGRVDSNGESANAKKARAEAAQLEVDVRARIPSLRITVTGVPAGVTPKVTVDGGEVPWAAITEPRKVDPGKHLVEVTVEGRVGRAEIDLAEKEDRGVTVAVPAAAPAVDDAPVATTTLEKPVLAGRPPPRSSTSALVYVGFGLAGAGLVVGSISGVMTLSRSSKVKDACPDGHCPPDAVDDLHSARTTGTISTISFVVAGAGVVLGVIGLLSGGPAPKDATDARVMPFVSLGGAGVQGAF